VLSSIQSSGDLVQDFADSEVQLCDQTAYFEFRQPIIATLLIHGKALDASYGASKNNLRDI
jgi:hypothetical protein